MSGKVKNISKQIRFSLFLIAQNQYSFHNQPNESRTELSNISHKNLIAVCVFLNAHTYETMFAFSGFDAVRLVAGRASGL